MQEGRPEPGAGRVSGRPAPCSGIRMKLGIDSHCKFRGFVLLSQALSEGLRGGSSFFDALAVKRSAVAQARFKKRCKASSD
jgi:hypothetical protein